jgi:predicted Fe-Mo cluster-binding NifX family protein
MGAGALNKLNSCNISVVRGCKGDIDNVVNAYLSGNLVDSGIGCSSHDEHHQCHNH